MVTAFVLVNVEDKKLRVIADLLLELPGVTEVHVVAGEYDMVAIMRVADNQTLSELITEKIVHVPGIHRTKTLFAMQSFSPFDLETIFQVPKA
jgi:DNA-binding Lrp family transcriptional regulator